MAAKKVDMMAAKTVVLLGIVMAARRVETMVGKMAGRMAALPAEMKVAKMALLKVAMTAACSVES